MRISTSLSHQLGINAILDQQAKQSKTQLQISTGLRLLSASDDPAASLRILDIEQSISATGQFQDNISTAYSRLSLEENTLENMTDVVQRMRELSVQAVNGSVGIDDLAGMEEEVRQLLDEFVSLANIQNSNGEYIFAGYKSQTQPFTGDATSGGFTWEGDNNIRNIQVGASRQIQDGDSGFDLFWDVQHTSGTNQSIFESMFDFANNISASASGTPSTDDITNIDYALNSLLEARSRVGARLNALDQQQSVNDSYLLDMETVLSDIKDLDVAEAATQLNLQSVALEAAQQAYIKVQGLSLFNYI